MAAVPSNREVREMVKQAMRYRAPAMYAELLANGELEAVVQDRADLFDEIFAGISSEAKTKALTSSLPFEDCVQMLEAGDRAGVEQGLAAALEFTVDTPRDDE